MNAEKPSRDSATLWIVVPFILAIVGTVVMLFTNSATALKVSLVLALWAGAAGIIAVARARRDGETARRELQARSERFAAELDAANARGEAASTRARIDATPGADITVLREIQEELAALRAQLEELSGREFGYEPAALRAEARRIAELEQAAGSTRLAWDEPAEPEEPAEPAEPVEPAELAAEKTASAPGPSSADTAEIKKVNPTEPQREATPEGRGRPAGAPSAEAISGRVGSQRGREASARVRLDNAHNPLSQLISERQADKPAAPEQSEPTPQPEPADRPEPAPHGGRRRRDEHGRSSLTVAELLARSKRDAE
ncbi:DUF6779 domain-containing protein [Corynebacterium liangguodongii]|uniref:Uncharacterized protein n=1 Tax=Corynebacterium liangguodongii TaxID=2079535 RepID=A0A2S0WFX8_9CORY|nr:DUF6779 domain-containing protein [Corynebacterium liangguodongii]AWB84660.1 hypothetical protein C3E79_09400 [Corynebacterium liangguodongii]PWB99668.1 hypothetical protein DF219_05180 [Corynebacterium liangguodongii]